MQEADPLLGSLAGPHPSRPRSAAEGGEGSGGEEGEHMEVVAEGGVEDSPSHHHHHSASEDPADPRHSDLDRISSSTSSLSLSSEWCVCMYVCMYVCMCVYMCLCVSLCVRAMTL